VPDADTKLALEGPDRELAEPAPEPAARTEP
jgi:hypothetical protein